MKSAVNSKIKFIYATLLLTHLCVSAISYGQQNYLFENISISEGLSSTQTQYIFQDGNGYLWISTADGLNRLDGKNIKVFKNNPSDSTTISNNNCFGIVEDSDGFIWIGVDGNSISRFNPKNETFKRYPIATGSVTNLSEMNTALFDSKGNLWFGTSKHGMQKYNKLKDEFEQVYLDSTNANKNWGSIFSMVELKNGNILVSDYGSGIKIFNEKLNQFQPYYLKSNYSPDFITSINEDASGNIWFGGKHKLIRYSPSYYSIENYDIFSLFKDPTNAEYITALTQDATGIIWAGVNSIGLFRIEPQSKKINKVEFSAGFSANSRNINSLYKIIKDKYGVVWLGTLGFGLFKFDPFRTPFNYSKFSKEEASKTSLNYITSIAGSPQSNSLTIGTSSSGMFSYDLEKQKSATVKLNVPPSTVPNGIMNIQSLAQDDMGNRWFSYNNSGLQKMERNNLVTDLKSGNEKKVRIFGINSIKIDQSDNLWIASFVGFEKYSPVKNEFTPLPTIMNKKMSQKLNNQIHEIPNSRVALASILKVGEASNLEKRFSLNKDQKVVVICVGEGEMFQGNAGVWDTGSLLTGDGKPIWTMNEVLKTFTIGGGFKNRIAVKCFDLKKGEYKITYATDVGHSYGSWNVEVPADSAWYGIQVLPVNETEYSSINEMTEKEISSEKYLPMERGTCIELSKRFYNVLWLGSFANSFFKYDLAGGNFKQYNFDKKNALSPNNSISYIYEDKEGIVWVATVNSLLRFDPVSEMIVRLDQKDGLPANQINSIIEDLQGNLWISTSGGLSKLNKNAPKEKWNFVNFDSKDGILSFSKSKATWISKEGEIVFGGADGIMSFYPGKINEVKPDVVIEDVKISDVSLKSESSIVKLKNSIEKTEEIDLSFNQNNISFEFASIHFSRPEKNKISYKLEGFNEQWISTDRNFVSFTNLEPREYNFRVKGSNGDGIWNEDVKSIRIVISPPWWKTSVAYVGYFFLFAGFIFGLDRIQRRRILTKERNNTAIKEAELRAQIAEAENERKSKELEEARQLQLSMLPKNVPQFPHLDIAVYMKTATEVGGDYYDFNVSLDGTLTVVLGDATGHGMRAGTMVTSAKSLFNSYASNPDILFTFREMTRCIKQMQFQSMAMCLSMLKIQNNKLVMSAAGMPPVYIYRKEQSNIEEFQFEGMPLGTMENFPYQLKQTELFKGDTLLVMSDGFPELVNDRDVTYGYKRARNSFEEVAEKEPEEIITYLKDAGSRWVNDKEPDDDVTFVVIKIK